MTPAVAAELTLLRRIARLTSQLLDEVALGRADVQLQLREDVAHWRLAYAPPEHMGAIGD